jgi:hypothetical protein
MGVGRIEKAPSQGLFSIFGGEGKSNRSPKPAWMLGLGYHYIPHTVIGTVKNISSLRSEA